MDGRSILLREANRLHGDGEGWHVADLPGALGIYLRLSRVGPPPLFYSAGLGDRAIVILAGRAADSPLGPAVLAEACAKVWLERRGLAITAEATSG